MFNKTRTLSNTLKYIHQRNLIESRRNIRNLSSYVIKSHLDDIIIPNVTIPELIQSKLEKFSNLTAAECAITGRKLTYYELYKKSTNLAKSLRKKLHLQESDVIAALLPNIPEYPVVVLGALEAGLILTTINPVYTVQEITRQLKDSSARALITLTDFWQTAKSSEKLLEKDLPILIIKTKKGESLPREAIDFNEFTDNIDYPNVQRRKPTDIAILPYSSGTTGLPKGVELTHRNIVANICQNTESDLNIIQEAHDSHQSVIPSILPIFHIFGLSICTLCGLYTGVKSVMLPKFMPELYVDVIKNHQADLLFVVPPLILFLTNHPSVKREHLQSIRTVLCGAAPLGALDEQKFIDKAGSNVSIVQGYGLTETSPSVTSSSVKQTKQSTKGDVGQPLANTSIKIINPETHEELGPNTPGELLVKGPQVMKGYHNKHDANQEVFLNGWLRTGDMAYYTDDRTVFITDRLKELIKVRGFQVPPAELEEIIRHYPNVVDAAVIGVPHPTDGEVPRAYIVVDDRTKIDVGKLKEFVDSRVAKYKQLNGGVVVVDSIPKNPSGKILRRQLKLQHVQEKPE